jgi:hypothetical protein
MRCARPERTVHLYRETADGSVMYVTHAKKSVPHHWKRKEPFKARLVMGAGRIRKVPDVSGRAPLVAEMPGMQPPDAPCIRPVLSR